jgi:hypothetical protein
VKQSPHLDELVGFVEVLREDYKEFSALMKGTNPPEWVPSNYRVIYVEETNQKDENQPTVIAKVTFKYLGQTRV